MEDFANELNQVLSFCVNIDIIDKEEALLIHRIVLSRYVDYYRLEPNTIDEYPFTHDRTIGGYPRHFITRTINLMVQCQMVEPLSDLISPLTYVI